MKQSNTTPLLPLIATIYQVVTMCQVFRRPYTSKATHRSACSVLATNAWHIENTGIKGGGGEQGEVLTGSNRWRQRQQLGRDSPARTAPADCSHGSMKQREQQLNTPETHSSRKGTERLRKEPRYSKGTERFRKEPRYSKELRFILMEHP